MGTKAREIDNGLRAAIAAAGGLRPLARLLKMSAPALREWRRVPAHRIVQIEAATGIAREQLRPDLYHRAARARKGKADDD